MIALMLKGSTRRFVAFVFLFTAGWVLARAGGNEEGLSRKVNPVPISSLHLNDPNGVPELIGDTVQVEGVVTVSDNFGITSYVEDSTGGVAIYGADFAGSVEIGDTVRLTGEVSQFYGLTELINVTTDSLIGTGGSPEPQKVSGGDIADEGTNGNEVLEGELVRVEDVTVLDPGVRWAPNATYNATDGTADFRIFIDNDAGIWGDSIPRAGFDLTGILGQYDTSSPYTEGYQVMPRFPADIVALSGPIFAGQFALSAIGSTYVDLSWSTEDSSFGMVMYGRTETYELGEVMDTAMVQDHLLNLDSLESSTFYHARVRAWTGDDTTTSRDLFFITASPTESPGEINVYFNKSVDTSYALPGNAALGDIDLQNLLLERIDGAQYSMDFCLYSLSLTTVASSIISAHNRGVSVRFIYETRSRQQAVQSLIDAGITVIDDAFGSNDGFGLQHNKFVIFDARDDSSAADDWLLTGSANWTGTGIYNNAQNLVLIQDKTLAKVYTREFNEMWGSVTDVPNPDSSRFGPRKLDDSPHRFNVGGVPVEMYMSPSDRVTNRILDVVRTSQQTVYFCILAFTRDDISGMMFNRFNNVPDFAVRGVFDSGQTGGSGSEYDYMSGWADVYKDALSGILHHKYMVLDGFDTDGNPTVITGSHNWSNAAERDNNENTLVIHDSTVANLFVQEFAQRYLEASGDSLPVPVETGVGVPVGYVPSEFSLGYAYPNPFNAVTRIDFALPTRGHVNLAVFDLLGRETVTLVDGELGAGKYAVEWDGRGAGGKPVSSGIYFLRLDYGGGGGRWGAVRKVLLLK